MKLTEIYNINKPQLVDRIVNMVRSDDPALIGDVMVVLQTKGIDDRMSVPEMEHVLMMMDDMELKRLHSQLEQVTRMG